MENERTIRFALILDGEEFKQMLGYELPRIGEHLAVDGILYKVDMVTRQYMTLFESKHDPREESRAAVSVSIL